MWPFLFHRIKNFDYPTVTHYIIANLFANMPIIKKDIDERLAELEDLSLKISDYTYNLKSKETLVTCFININYCKLGKNN